MIEHVFGHPSHIDEEGIERYDDTLEPVAFASKRPCPQCHLLPTAEGYDPCIGKTEGAISVCCGHGITEGYIMWQPGVEVMESELPRLIQSIIHLWSGFGRLVFDPGVEYTLRQYRHLTKID